MFEKDVIQDVDDRFVFACSWVDNDFNSLVFGHRGSPLSLSQKLETNRDRHSENSICVLIERRHSFAHGFLGWCIGHLAEEPFYRLIFVGEGGKTAAGFYRKRHVD